LIEDKVKSSLLKAGKSTMLLWNRKNLKAVLSGFLLYGEVGCPLTGKMLRDYPEPII